MTAVTDTEGMDINSWLQNIIPKFTAAGLTLDDIMRCSADDIVIGELFEIFTMDELQNLKQLDKKAMEKKRKNKKKINSLHQIKSEKNNNNAKRTQKAKQKQKQKQKNNKKSKNQKKATAQRINPRNRQKKATTQWVRVYGDYHCQLCNERWSNAHTLQTRDALRLRSQECYECGYGVYAYYVHALCYYCKDYPCRCEDFFTEERVYGYYSCRKCRHVWESAYTFQERGTKKILYAQECIRCTVNNFAIETKPLDRNKFFNDPNKAHIQSLCGKCRYKTHPCTYHGFYK